MASWIIYSNRYAIGVDIRDQGYASLDAKFRQHPRFGAEYCQIHYICFSRNAIQT